MVATANFTKASKATVLFCSITTQSFDAVALVPNSAFP
jgi:hypothetical protein